ncbi:MauE/DoxX family redox-associated membrane protein [Coraliomargarita parva]|uniref:MauE/DoxX family redox-associated membrane protein n=1 Tax=Coraliomargarita parva TaxID=3014050 RepID=UPI0022B45785|nr:MauE/DoxX family redox-associated membrane protein [Coraliomargarita parva]
MTTHHRLSAVRLLVQLVLAGVFVTAAFNKILDPQSFAVSVTSYRVLPLEASPWIALFLPWLEIFAGFGLLIRPIQRASSLTVSTLLLMFIGINLAAWVRGLEVSCGCFGASEVQTNYAWLITRNSIFWLGSLGLVWSSWRNAPARLRSQADSLE